MFRSKAFVFLMIALVFFLLLGVCLLVQGLRQPLPAVPGGFAL